FFFQAEDGIRDKLVTGVQTCALPIYKLPGPGVRACISTHQEALVHPVRSSLPLLVAALIVTGCVEDGATGPGPSAPNFSRRGPRSEERRVGKESRPWVALQPYKKKHT